MSDFASIPCKLVKPTKNGDKIKMTVYVDETPYSVVLKVEKAKLLCDALFSAINSVEKGELRRW